MAALYFLYQIVLLNKKSTNQELGKKLIVSCCTILTPYIMTLVRMLKETSEEMLNNDLQPESRVKGFKTSQVIVSKRETVNMVNLPSSSMYQTFMQPSHYFNLHPFPLLNVDPLLLFETVKY